MDKHEWKPVVGFEGIYEVRQGTDGGRVRRVTPVKRSYVGRELGRPDQQGYVRVILSKPGCKPKHERVHRLVLEAFVGPCPPGREACHRDDNKLNNTVANLYWGTRNDNMKDSYRNQLRPDCWKSGEDHHNSKLSNEDRIRIREMRSGGVPVENIAQQFGISKMTVYRLTK